MKSRSRWAVLPLLCGLAISCRSHGDLLTTLRIEGKVESKGLGLPGTKVYFVDTGLDEAGRRIREERLVGTTDASGRVDVSWTYLWGYTSVSRLRRRGNPAKDVPGTFELIFKTDSAVARREFKLWSLQKRGKEYLVPFDVTL